MSEPLWQRALTPLQAPYAAALAAKNLAYTRGWLHPRALAWPVVSIGNLSVGGAGKTPVVIALAHLLTRRGLHVDVLSRGYSRQSPAPVERVRERVRERGRERGLERGWDDGDALRFGDEPLLIAQAARVPVYVGASRFAAGVLAEREGAALPGIHLLDDGFQHRKLARSIDIVVMHPTDASGDASGRLLPVGRLREPLSTLRRADFLILREDDAGTEAALRANGIHKPIWRVRRVLAPPAIPSLAGSSAVAFCAIAHPQDFFAGLRAHGIPLSHTLAFRDHHRFRARDMEAIVRRAAGAACVLTTEKDWVRLSPAAHRQLSLTAPLLAVPLRAEILDADACVSALLHLLAARHPPGGDAPGSMRE